MARAGSSGYHYQDSSNPCDAQYAAKSDGS